MIKYAVYGRAVALAFLLSGAAALPAGAQEIPEAHLTAARQAIASLNITDRYDEILPGLAERLKAQLIQSNPNWQAQISQIVDEQALALAPRRADLEKEAATIYAKSFSPDELKSISGFFNSDAGKKLLSNQPLVARELGKAAEIWANGISRDMTDQSSAKLMVVLNANPIKAPVVDATPAPAAAPATPAAAPAAKPVAPAAKPAAPAAKPAPTPKP